MRRHLFLAAAVTAALCGSGVAQAESWVFRPSYYTHDLATGQRVAQFAPAVTPCLVVDPTYQRSGFRHSESTLAVGDSADHTHIVETWGQGASIRPYGEWLYPYRPGATPYNPGGAPRGPWTNPPGAMANPYGANPYGTNPYGANLTPYAPGMVPPYPQPNPGPYAQPNPGSYVPQNPALYPPSNPAPSTPPNPEPGDVPGT